MLEITLEIYKLRYKFDGFGVHYENDNVLDLIVSMSSFLKDVTFVQSPSLTHEYIVTRPDTKEVGVVNLVCESVGK